MKREQKEADNVWQEHVLGFFHSLKCRSRAGPAVACQSVIFAIACRSSRSRTAASQSRLGRALDSVWPGGDEPGIEGEDIESRSVARLMARRGTGERAVSVRVNAQSRTPSRGGCDYAPSIRKSDPSNLALTPPEKSASTPKVMRRSKWAV